MQKVLLLIGCALFVVVVLFAKFLYGAGGTVPVIDVFLLLTESIKLFALLLLIMFSLFSGFLEGLLLAVLILGAVYLAAKL